MTIDYTQIIVAFVMLFAGQGFWNWIMARNKQNSDEQQLIVGVAHAIIVNEATKYLDRGYITTSEFETFHHFLLKPYLAMGGNGLAIKMAEELHGLPSRPPRE